MNVREMEARIQWYRDQYESKIVEVVQGTVYQDQIKALKQALLDKEGTVKNLSTSLRAADHALAAFQETADKQRYEGYDRIMDRLIDRLDKRDW